MSRQPVDLGNRIFLIDGFDLGMSGRTGTYVIREEKLTIVETSASPSIPYVRKGLQDLEIDLKEIEYIIVTHIHLDHSGGAGLLLQDCPNAKVVVHPKGARHLANPSKLIQGAKAVYGEKFDRLFNPILPVPEERIIIKDDRETLSIGSNRTLQFFDTPGHANHHFSIYDPVSNGIFTGDTIGVRYHQVQDCGFTMYLPSTSPNQFDPEAMKQSMELIKQLQVERIYFSHYGMSMDVEDVYSQMDHWLPIFVETAAAGIKKEQGIADIATEIYKQVQMHVTKHNVPTNHPVYDILKLDIEVCAMGLVDYLFKKKTR